MTNQETQNLDFDPSSILSFTASPQATGNAALESPGLRPMTTIQSVTPYPPSERFPKPGCLARVKFVFSVDNSNEELVKRIDLYEKMKDTQKMYELLFAVWGERMTEFSIGALEGCKLPIYIKHARNTQSEDPKAKYADYTYETTGPVAENCATAEANMAKLPGPAPF